MLWKKKSLPYFVGVLIFSLFMFSYYLAKQDSLSENVSTLKKAVSASKSESTQVFAEPVKGPKYNGPKKIFNVTAENWIVVTTIAYPTDDVKFLADIPGWKVVIIGDTKTPSDWSHPNCIYLSVEDQLQLGYDTVELLPVKNYARKNVGFLFAIEHGAKVIYETDDDNRPLDLLKNFVLTPDKYGLTYDGEKLFNPYRHFGQPTLWPRGYPLSAVGAENISTLYRLAHFKTPSVQQGVVNGDPDMGAMFRLTRKRTLSILNVTFDGLAPPAILPRGVFAPFNSQNTLFMYDAFWGLLLPTTTTFRVCDIWRGYWTQRLLWETGNNLGFYPPNAFQKRNAHSYLADAVQEKDLYFKTEEFLKFLGSWQCKPENSFFDCIIQLSSDMVGGGFWGQGDVTLTEKWVEDLKAIGYREPQRVVPDSLPSGVKSMVDPGNAGVNKVNFWAVLQEPPLKFPIKPEPTIQLKAVSRAASYCDASCLPSTAISSAKSIPSFPNIVLVIVFKSPEYDNIPALENVYRLNFPRIVYCGPQKSNFDSFAQKMKPVTFVEATGGSTHLSCMLQVFKMGYNVDGYVVSDASILFNIKNVGKLPLDKLWIYTNPKSESTSGENCIRPENIAFYPRRYKEEVLSLAKGKQPLPEANAAVSCKFKDSAHKLTGKALQSFDETITADSMNQLDALQIPAPLYEVLKSKEKRQFYCKNYLPLMLYIANP